MLSRQEGGRNRTATCLPAIATTGCPQRHLGLAEADVAADNRSIGLPPARSSMTSAIARSWSSVSG